MTLGYLKIGYCITRAQLVFLLIPSLFREPMSIGVARMCRCPLTYTTTKQIRPFLSPCEKACGECLFRHSFPMTPIRRHRPRSRAASHSPHAVDRAAVDTFPPFTCLFLPPSQATQLEHEWKSFAAALEDRSHVLRLSGSFHLRADTYLQSCVRWENTMHDLDATTVAELQDAVGSLQVSAKIQLVVCASWCVGK